jgi:hypothetical protein
MKGRFRHRPTGSQVSVGGPDGIIRGCGRAIRHPARRLDVSANPVVRGMGRFSSMLQAVCPACSTRRFAVICAPKPKLTPDASKTVWLPMRSHVRRCRPHGKAMLGALTPSASSPENASAHPSFERSLGLKASQAKLTGQVHYDAYLREEGSVANSTTVRCAPDAD